MGEQLQYTCQVAKKGSVANRQRRWQRRWQLAADVSSQSAYIVIYLRSLDQEIDCGYRNIRTVR